MRIHRVAGLAGVVSTALAACASPAHRGEERSFAVQNEIEIKVPAEAKEVRAWIALPDRDEPLQEVANLHHQVTGPIPAKVSWREVQDAEGNRFLAVAARDVPGQTLRVTTSFDLRRWEARHDVEPADTTPLTDADKKRMAPYLADSTHVVATPAIREAALAAVGDATNPVQQARLLYDWVLGHSQYWVKFPATMKASSVGSSAYCFDQATGNCTDFHSLYVAGAHAVGLPARLVYGSFLKGPLEGQDRDQSYHCWVEFWGPKVGWVPLDVAVADIFVDDFELNAENQEKVDLTVAAGYHGPDPKLVDYYFGNLDARRVTWHRGRDLVIEDGPSGGPVNALPKAVVEIDGKPAAENAVWTRKLTFASAQ